MGVKILVKFLICSDAHVCKYSSILRKRGKKYSERLHNIIDSLNWVERLAEEENCTHVVYAGDTMDRPDLDAEEITALQEIKFSDLKHIMLTGNHESNVANLYFSSIKIFKGKADIITKPKVMTFGDVELYFIPYIPGRNKLALSDYISQSSKKKVIITHNDIAGIQYGRFKSESGFDIDDILENSTLFLNGHLHNGTMFSNKLVLLGNITGLNFNEDASKYDHYAYLLTISDDGTIDLEPRINPYAYNFYKIYINKECDIQKIKNLKNNAVVSVICNSDLLTKVEKELIKDKSISAYKIVANYEIHDNASTVDFSVEDHLKQFIDYVQTKIDPSDTLSEELAILGRE